MSLQGHSFNNVVYHRPNAALSLAPWGTFIPIPAADLAAKHGHVREGQGHRKHHGDPEDAMQEDATDPNRPFLMKRTSMGRRLPCLGVCAPVK